MTTGSSKPEKFEQFIEIIRHGNLEEVRAEWNDDYVDIKHRDSTVLHWAVEFGVVEIVEFLLLKGCNINAIDKYGQTVLHKAAVEGHISVIKLLIENSPNINTKNMKGRTPICEAVAREHQDAVELLIKARADLNIKDNGGWTTVHTAAARGNEKIMEILINSGADTNLINNRGQTAIDIAKYMDRIECFTLLKRKVNMNQYRGRCRGSMRSKSFRLSSIGHDMESNSYKWADDFVDKFVKSGSILTDIEKDWIERAHPPHIIERLKNNPLSLEESIESEREENRNYMRELQLYRSIKFSNSKVFENMSTVELVNKPKLIWVSTLFVQNIFSESALQLAMKAGCVLILGEVLKLIEGGSRVLIAFCDSYQEYKSYKIYQALIKRITLLERYEKMGYNTLDIAVLDNSIKMIKHVLKNDIKYNNQNELISRALSIALSNNKIESVDILMQYDVDYSYHNKMGENLFHTAVENRASDKHQILLEQCVLEEKDYFGLTAMHKAVIRKEEKLCATLARKDWKWNLEVNITLFKPSSLLNTTAMVSQNDVVKIFGNLYQIPLLAISKLTQKENAVSLCLKIHDDIFDGLIEQMSLEDVVWTDGAHNTALHCAARNFNGQLCQKILSISSAPIRMTNYDGLTPLRLTIEEAIAKLTNGVTTDILDTVSCLIKAGADLEQEKQLKTKSIFQRGFDLKNEALLITLLDNFTINKLTQTEFQYLFDSKFYQLIPLLIPKLKKSLTCTLLHCELIDKIIKEIPYSLLKMLFSFLEESIRSHFCNECLLAAFLNKDEDFFEILCKIKLNRTILVQDGETIMTLLIKLKEEKYLAHLLDLPDVKHLVNRRNMSQKLPLHLTIEYNLLDILMLLLNYVEDINAEDDEGNSGLVLLMKQLNEDVITGNRILALIYNMIEKKADIYRVSDLNGRNPMSYCPLKYRSKIEQYFFNYKNGATICTDTDTNKGANESFNKEELMNICIICWDRRIDCVVDCGHTCCMECANKIYECHECRNKITKRMKLFL